MQYNQFIIYVPEDLRFAQFMSDFAQWMEDDKGITDMFYIENGPMSEHLQEYLDLITKEQDD